MKKKKEISELEAQALLVQMVNDTPIPIVIDGETYHITALKLGVMNLIAEESCKIQKAQEGNMLDLFKQFAQSIPSVIRCLCYAVLNDKDKIFKNYSTREYSDEYQALYESLEWCSDKTQWMDILVQVMQRIDLSFFMKCAGTLTMIRESVLKTRKTIIEHT